MFKKIITTMFFVFTSSFAQTFSPNGNYASVNGLKMYYEVHLPDGQAGGNNPHKPVLVLIHGGGSTIITSFGTILPMLTKHRTVIAVELQGHGHTGDRNTPESFEQDADDVAALLNELKIKQADFLGFSNGGSTVLQIGIRHPETVRKLIVVAGVFQRNGFPPQFWDGMKQATLDNMPEKLKEAYLKVAPNPKDLIQMFNKDLQRMLTFKDFRSKDVRAIQSPTFIINGDADVVLPEHAVEMFRLLPYAKLAILPGGHGECIGEIEYADKQSSLPQATVSMVEEFLDAPMRVEDSTRREKK